MKRLNLKLLNKLYSKGKAAYGSKANLVKASNLPASTVETILQNKPAHTNKDSLRASGNKRVLDQDQQIDPAAYNQRKAKP